MRIYSALLAAVLFFAGMATMKVLGPGGVVGLIATPAVAATPNPYKPVPPGPVAAQCAKGFSASPATYTQSELNSDVGVKYSCSRLWPAKRSPFSVGFSFICSPKFSALGKNSGADAPNVTKGKATYFCISSAHIR